MDALPCPELWILRHGETAWNRDGILQGGRDSALTARGRVQAARQGAILRAHGVTAPARVSPQGRARDTARLAGLDARVEPALRELAMGAWEGRRLAEVAPPPGLTWKFAAPGGEDRATLTARAAALLSALDGPAVLVTHGVTGTVLRALATGRDDLDATTDPQGVVHHIVGGRERVLG